uniref:Uncharacterized protein n=1 Tax=Peromyscus maniculatus bairdii TaxID=230844 RepID=A0A8C8UF10_PERMB
MLPSSLKRFQKIPFWWLLAPEQSAGVSLHPSAPSKFYEYQPNWLDVGLSVGTTVSILLWSYSSNNNDTVQYDRRNELESTLETRMQYCCV